MNLINNVQYKILLHTYPYKLLVGWESCTSITFTTTVFYLFLAFLFRSRAVTFGVFLVSFVSFTVFFSPLPAAAGFGTFFSPFLDLVCKKQKDHHTYNAFMTLTHQCSVNISFIIYPMLDRQTRTSCFGFLVGISIGTSCGISSSSVSFSSSVSLVFRSDTSVFWLSLFLFCAP